MKDIHLDKMALGLREIQYARDHANHVQEIRAETSVGGVGLGFQSERYIREVIQEQWGELCNAAERRCRDAMIHRAREISAEALSVLDAAAQENTP